MSLSASNTGDPHCAGICPSMMVYALRHHFSVLLDLWCFTLHGSWWLLVLNIHPSTQSQGTRLSCCQWPLSPLLTNLLIRQST